MGACICLDRGCASHPGKTFATALTALHRVSEINRRDGQHDRHASLRQNAIRCCTPPARACCRASSVALAGPFVAVGETVN